MDAKFSCQPLHLAIILPLRYYIWGEREKAKKAYGHDDSSGPVIAVWRKINDHQYDEALALCEKLQSPLFRNDMLSLIYKRKGDYRNAYFVQQRYWEMRDSINSRRHNRTRRRWPV